MSLATKYRPRTLDDMVGNSAAVELIKNQFVREKPHQSYLIYGPYGCGKTTLARVIGKMAGCGLDYFEFNSSSFRGIDSSRYIEESLKFRPMDGNSKVYILDECHQITKDAQEALLKSLEEPPEDVYFILLTTDPDKLSKGILSSGRIMKCEVKPLTFTETYDLVHKIVTLEEIDLDQKIEEEILKRCGGIPRVCIELLESVIGIEDPSAAIEILDMAEVVVPEAEINQLCQALLKGASFKSVVPIIKGLKGNPEQIRRRILAYLEAVLHGKGDERTAKLLAYFKEPYTYTDRAGLTLSCYLCCRMGK